MNTQILGMRFKVSIMGGVVILLSGCAGVNFYSDPELTKKTGIPIYGAKPYVLVARTKAKDKPVEISIQYVTDRSQVIYADPRSGFGSSDLKLALDHGQLTQFGQVTDTKIPELLEAVSGLLTSRATAAKTLAEADVIKRGAVSTTQAVKIPDADALKSIKSLLQDMSGPQASSDIGKLDKSEKDVVNKVRDVLVNIVEAVDKPEKAGLLPGLGEQLIALAKQFAELPEPPVAPSARTTALQRIADWKPKLAGIVGKITQEEPSNETDFELYEILSAPTGMSLRRVQ